jgi:hypothetical protein
MAAPYGYNSKARKTARNLNPDNEMAWLKGN